MLHGPMQTDFRRVTRNAQPAGDFVMRQAFDLAETSHRPRVLRQLLERLRERQARKDRSVVGRRLLGRRIVDTTFSAQVGPTAHQRRAHGQSGKPRVEATLLFVSAERDGQRQEHLLHDIVGIILGVGPPAGHHSDQRLVVPIEPFEPVRVARGDIVGEGGPFDHVRQWRLRPRPRSERVIIHINVTNADDLTGTQTFTSAWLDVREIVPQTYPGPESAWRLGAGKNLYVFAYYCFASSRDGGI